MPTDDSYYVKSDIRSIRTSKCVMLFSEDQCLGRSIKIRSPGTTDLNRHWASTVTGVNTLSQLYKSFPNWIWATKSFQSCTNSKGQDELNVKITHYHANLNRVIKPDVYETHRNVCTCHNIPKHVRTMNRWSMSNNGNSLLAYFEQDCVSNAFSPIRIPAGQSSYSIALGTFYQVNQGSDFGSKIMSFGPDHESDYFKSSCIKMYSTIIKFEITEQNYIEQNVEMTASESHFTNDGPAQISQTFTASKTVIDLFRVDIGSSLRSMHKVDLESSFEVETKMSNSTVDSKTKKTRFGTSISTSINGSLNKIGLKGDLSVSGSISNEHTGTSTVAHEEGLKEGLRKAFQN